MNLSHSCSTHWQVEAHFLWLISSNITYIHLQTASNGGFINIFQDVMETVNITTCSEHQPPSPHHHALPDVESNHVHHAGARHVIRWATSSERQRRQHQLAGAPGRGHRIPQDTTGCRKETRTNGHFHSEICLWCLYAVTCSTPPPWLPVQSAVDQTPARCKLFGRSLIRNQLECSLQWALQKTHVTLSARKHLRTPSGSCAPVLLFLSLDHVRVWRDLLSFAAEWRSIEHKHFVFYRGCGLATKCNKDLNPCVWSASMGPF